MKKITYCLLLLLGFSVAASAQNLISSTYKGARTKNQLISQLGVPFIQYGAKYYKVTYTSPDPQGNLDTLSGLMAVPDNDLKTYPRVVYQHGTSDCKACVPSRYGVSGGEEGQIGLLFAGMGYVALLPDYVGMGDGRGFQTYVHSKTEASAAADLVRASTAFVAQNNYSINDQLFITGYSQGGHGAMAFHKDVEENLSNEMTVTAAAHLSGPYSVSGVMRDLILNEAVYYSPAYIPNTVLGLQTAYGDLYTDLSEVFKSNYVPFIQQYYNGTITLSSLNLKIIQTLTAETGASVPRRMLQDAFLEELTNNPDNKANIALRDNDLFDWAPQAPTRIFYCMADDQVPYLNSVVTLDTMLALGAPNLAGSDVNPAADHGACYNPAMTQTLLFFAGYQQITVGANPIPAEVSTVKVSPNPASDVLTLTGLKGKSIVQLTDQQGRIVYFRDDINQANWPVSVGQLPNGLYVVQVLSEGGGFTTQKVMIER